jgi:hypothetical protein
VLQINAAALTVLVQTQRWPEGPGAALVTTAVIQGALTAAQYGMRGVCALVCGATQPAFLLVPLEKLTVQLNSLPVV